MIDEDPPWAAPSENGSWRKSALKAVEQRSGSSITEYGKFSNHKVILHERPGTDKPVPGVSCESMVQKISIGEPLVRVCC